MDDIKPFLRWAGSKRKQVPVLRQYWSSEFHRYVEPFAGSVCLFLAVRPDRAVLSDLNSDLIGTYDVVRRMPGRVYEMVTAIPRTKTRYYAERHVAPESLSPLRRAARFIYLNRNCFNGIYRTNTDGAFNVPFADSRAGAFVTRDEFVAAAKLLRSATLAACDFGTTLSRVRKGDFVYLDPPYALDARRVFREYGAKAFCGQDLRRLSRHLFSMDRRGANFLVSYADCRESRELASDWCVRRMRVRRHVAGFAGARKAAYELLISNFEPAAA